MGIIRAHLYAQNAMLWSTVLKNNKSYNFLTSNIINNELIKQLYLNVNKCVYPKFQKKPFLRQIWQLENTCKTKCILNNNVWFSVNFPYQRVIPHSPSYSLNTIDCVYVNLFIASNVISAHISWSWGGAAAVDDNLMVAVNALSFSWTNHVALLCYAL